MTVPTLNSLEKNRYPSRGPGKPRQAPLLTLEDLLPGGCDLLRLLGCCDGGAFCRNKHEW